MMKPTQFFRALPRHTIPLMLVTWLWQGIVYWGPKLVEGARTHYNLTTAVDRMIPFAPVSAPVYIAAFVSWIAVYLYCAAQDMKRACRFLCAEFLAKCLCLLCFLALPTAIVRPEVTGHSLWEFLVRLVYWLDTPTNLFPSIHCLMSWMCYLGVRDLPRAPQWLKTGLCVFAVAVFASVLLMKQHFLADVLAGVALAELCYRLAANRRVLDVYTRAAERIVDAFYAFAGKKLRYKA